jgi:hypothetical protein
MWMKACIDPRASGDVSEIRMSPTACAGHLNGCRRYRVQTGWISEAAESSR